MPEVKTTPKNEEPRSEYELYKDEWMVRPCEMYKEEYNDCETMQARFHQYFIFGKYIDCTQWKKDYDNCYKWKKYKSEEAFDKLVSSEKERRLRRLEGHYNNDVWQRRDKPPENWNAPLPKWIEEKSKASYLNIVKDKLKQEVKIHPESSCVLILPLNQPPWDGTSDRINDWPVNPTMYISYHF